MEVSNMEGVEGDGLLPLLAAKAEYIIRHHTAYENEWEAIGRSFLAEMRKRGYLTPEAIEQLKKEGL